MDADDLEGWPTGRLLSTAARLVEHAWNAHLAAWDLNHAGVAVLHVLGAGPLTQRDLAVQVAVQEQTVSRTLDRLERCGYVERHRDPADRRRMLVSRTPVGAQVLAEAADPATAEAVVLRGVEAPQELRRALVAVVRELSAQRWGEPAGVEARPAAEAVAAPVAPQPPGARA